MTYVDERVVELRFDNKQFEQETAKSMSTLDKLKEKLQFKNASAGAEQLQKAVANINVNPIVEGIGTIETKMSALSIAGKRVIENLVDWAMTGVHKVSHALQTPINQIINGGKARAKNIEQAKFQLEGLGVSWSDIEEDISYGVQDTAYGLDAAAKVASQLVASQVQLGDEMKHSLLGISGVAAMTNSSYEDIGRIYTTVAGNGRLMGDQLLQLSSRGINAAATLGKAFDKTEADIRDMVSKGQISFQMFSEAMFESFGEHAKSANKTFSGALSNTKAALSRLGADVAAQGFNSIRDILNDIIPKLKEFKKKMKPVEDSIITMVDAIGKLVQTFIKAIDIKSIVDRIAPPIQKACDTITEFLDAFRLIKEESKVKNFTAFIEEQKGLKKLQEQAEKTGEAMIDLTKVTEEQKQMARDIWEKGSYGNGEERVRALGDDYAYVQGYLEKLIELGFDEEKLNEELAKQKEEQAEQDEREAKAAKRRETVEKLIAIFNNLKRVVKNVFKSITNVLSVAFDSLKGEFGSKSVLDNVVTLTDKIADFSDKIMITEDRAQKLKPVFTAIFTIFKTLAKVVIAIAKGLATVIGWIGDLIRKAKESVILGKIFDAAKTAVNALIDAFKNFYNYLKQSGAWDKFVDILKDIAYWIGDRLVDAFNGVAFLASNAADGLVTAWDWVKDKVKAVVEFFEGKLPSLKEFRDVANEKPSEGSWLDTFKNVLLDIAGAGKDVFKKAFEFGKDLMSGIIAGINSITLEDVARATGIVGKIATTIAGVKWLFSMSKMNKAFSDFALSLGGLLDNLAGTLKAYGRKANADAFANFANSIIKIVGSIILLLAAFVVLDKMGYNAYEIIDKVSAIILTFTILVGAVKVLTERFSKEANSTTYNILPSLKIPQMALTLFAIALALSTVIHAMAQIYNIKRNKDFDEGMWIDAVGLVTFIVLGLLAFAAVAIKFAKATTGLEGLSLIIFSISLLLKSIIKAIQGMVKILAEYPGTGSQAIGMIALLLFELLGLTSVMLLAGSITGNSINVKGILGVLIGITILLRVGVTALLNTVSDIMGRKDGSKTLHHVEDFLENLMKFIMIFSGVMILLTGVAEVFGVNTGKIKSTFNSISLVIASIGAMVYMLGVAIEKMKDTDLGTIDKLKSIVISFEIFIGVLVALVAFANRVPGAAAGMTATLLSIAAVIASVGVAFLGVGSGIYIFEKALENLMYGLPGMIAQIPIILQTIADSVEPIVKALMDLLINTILAVARQVYMRAGEFGEALGKLAASLLFGLVDLIIGVLKGLWDEAKKWFNKFWDWLFDPDKQNFEIEESEAVKQWEDQVDDMFGLQDKLEKRAGLQGGSILSMKFKLMPNIDATNVMNNIDSVYDKISERTGIARDKLSYEMLTPIEKEQIENYLKPVYDYQPSVDEMIKSGYAFGEAGGLNYSNGVLEGWEDGSKTLSGSDMAKAAFDYEGADDYLDEANEMWKQFGAEGALSNYYGYEEGMEDLLDQNKYGESGWSTTEQYAEAAEEAKGLASGAASEIAKSALEKFYELEPEYYEAGKYCSVGFSSGLSDKKMVDLIGYSARALVLDAKNGLTDEAKIESPSKVFMQLGRYVTLGFAQGISSLSNAAETATEDLGEDSVSALESVIKRIFDTTIEGMDTNPRITPVLDLSQVQTGLDTLDGMFTNRSSFGLAFSNASAYNNNTAAKFAAMNQTPNGYDDTRVVDAITRLGNDISNLKESMSEMGVYIDKKTLVGAIADPMHEELDKINVSTGRGVR